MAPKLTRADYFVLGAAAFRTLLSAIQSTNRCGHPFNVVNFERVAMLNA